jgi:hypothetical protein
LYLVCLITLIISIFAAVSLVRNTVELLYPDPSYSSYGPVKPGVVEDDLSRRLNRESQQRYAVLGLVSAGATLLITGPLYAYHWRRVQSERVPRGRDAVPTEPPPPPA